MEISRKEFNELYGYVEVTFASYYKYSFTYTGKTNSGDAVVVVIGGCADDIYKIDVTADEKVKVNDIEATYASVTDNDNDDENAIHSYSDYY